MVKQSVNAKCEVILLLWTLEFLSAVRIQFVCHHQSFVTRVLLDYFSVADNKHMHKSMS